MDKKSRHVMYISRFWHRQL